MARGKEIAQKKNRGLSLEERLAEKDTRHREKRRLQDLGELPPDKPALNRKRFAERVMSEYEAMEPKRLAFYMWKVTRLLVSADMPQVSPEQVGMLKLVKAAIELERFESRQVRAGRPRYTKSALYEQVIEPVIKL